MPSMSSTQMKYYDETGEPIPPEFVLAGYHYCPDWDMMLIGPGSSEMSGCSCGRPQCKSCED